MLYSTSLKSTDGLSWVKRIYYFNAKWIFLFIFESLPLQLNPY